ncbi:MAG TPA: acetyl-CoA carboxylase biotin carboxyl carrier protein subunit [Candidatus Bathyarchaeia archaeon]|nr:acetyl-CoA carboxylase biotin carboxyl carrier protein subunit [Candidatus Bathyarchaeia archaeon]
MEFKVDETQQEIDGDVLHSLSDGSVILKINQKDYQVKILKSGTDEVEFIFENSFHFAKTIRSNSSETTILVDGYPLTIRKHFKFADLLKALPSTASVGNNNLASQIPGRVVNILLNVGSAVKAGDSVVVLESMKMQVAIKAHKDGNIRDIKVKKGMTVGRNDVVATIE